MRDMQPFVVTFEFATMPIVNGPCTLDAVLCGEIARTVAPLDAAIRATPLARTEGVSHGSALIVLGDTGVTRTLAVVQRGRAAIERLAPGRIPKGRRRTDRFGAKNLLSRYPMRLCDGGAWLGTGHIEAVRAVLGAVIGIGKRRAAGAGMIDPGLARRRARRCRSRHLRARHRSERSGVRNRAHRARAPTAAWTLSPPRGRSSRCAAHRRAGAPALPRPAQRPGGGRRAMAMTLDAVAFFEAHAARHLVHGARADACGAFRPHAMPIAVAGPARHSRIARRVPDRRCGSRSMSPRRAGGARPGPRRTAPCTGKGTPARKAPRCGLGRARAPDLDPFTIANVRSARVALDARGASPPSRASPQRGAFRPRRRRARPVLPVAARVQHARALGRLPPRPNRAGGHRAPSAPRAVLRCGTARAPCAGRVPRAVPRAGARRAHRAH